MKSFLESAFQCGDGGKRRGLFASVYPELKRLAARHMRSERSSPTMQVTALVHEAYLRMARNPNWNDTVHFFALASQSMRHVLVDRARARLAQKRLNPDEIDPFHGFETPQRFIELHDALNRLARIDARQAQVVELRFFGGCKEEEIAQALGVNSRTVKRDWTLARVWLYGELSR